MARKPPKRSSAQILDFTGVTLCDLRADSVLNAIADNVNPEDSILVLRIDEEGELIVYGNKSDRSGAHTMAQLFLHKEMDALLNK